MSVAYSFAQGRRCIYSKINLILIIRDHASKKWVSRARELWGISRRKNNQRSFPRMDVRDYKKHNLLFSFSRTSRPNERNDSPGPGSYEVIG